MSASHNTSSNRLPTIPNSNWGWMSRGQLMNKYGRNAIQQKRNELVKSKKNALTHNMAQNLDSTTLWKKGYTPNEVSAVHREKGYVMNGFNFFKGGLHHTRRRSKSRRSKSRRSKSRRSRR
jgi:hypothetical protein